MKLTGKCKEDFEMFIFRQKGTLPKGIESYNYYDLQESYIISDIINWFDSVEIYICITPVFPINKYGFSYSVDLKYYYDIFNTRTEAAKAAIIKANEIYNDKHKL
jgi:hypothetical protein